MTTIAERLAAAGISLPCQSLAGIVERPATVRQHHDRPNRNGSSKDRVMAVKALPSQEVLRQLLRYEPETGKLFWLPRTEAMFEGHNRSAKWLCAIWSSKNGGTEAFTNHDRKGYLRGKIYGKNFLAHRVIWKLARGADPDQIDHINGVKSDNRLANLRECSGAQNCQNRPNLIASSSRFRGVRWSVRDKNWRADIGVRSTKIHLGVFSDEADAALAYDRAAIAHHGDFAILNFPREANSTALDKP